VDVEELLARAWAAVEKAGIPEPFQEYAFKEALAHLSGQVLTPVASGGNGNGSINGAPPGNGEEPGTALGTDEERFAKFARESGIALADLERVFYFANGEPHLNGPRAKLGKNTSEQAKSVAVALTAAYDYALDRKPIGDEVVRAEAVRLKCDLGGNWARTMSGIVGVSWVGANRQKQFKVKGDTADTLRKIVTAALGEAGE
jgi:hypothetical protein